MTLTPEMKEIYASAPNDVQYIETLSLSHSQFSQEFYLTNDYRNWPLRLENGDYIDFMSAPFKIKLPTSNTEGGQELQFSIANLGRVITDELEAAAQIPTEAIVAKYRIYTSVENSFPQNDPVMTMNIVGISLDGSFINATAGRFDILNARFPRVLYNTDDFPGLKR